MPNLRNAKKSLRQNIARAARNKVRRDAFREAVKDASKAKSAADAKKLAVLAQKALDKAAKTGVIKKNTASRRLSRLMVKINAMK